MLRCTRWSLSLIISAIAVGCGKLGYESDDDAWLLTTDGGPSTCDVTCNGCSNFTCTAACLNDGGADAADCGRRHR